MLSKIRSAVAVFIMVALLGSMIAPIRLFAEETLRVVNSISMDISDPSNQVKPGGTVYLAYNLAVSDGSEALDAGAYSRIVLPKRYFETPNTENLIDKNKYNVRDVFVEADENFWIIKLVYNRLAGGTDLKMPLRVRLTETRYFHSAEKTVAIDCAFLKSDHSEVTHNAYAFDLPLIDPSPSIFSKHLSFCPDNPQDQQYVSADKKLIANYTTLFNVVMKNGDGFINDDRFEVTLNEGNGIVFDEAANAHYWQGQNGHISRIFKASEYNTGIPLSLTIQAPFDFSTYNRKDIAYQVTNLDTGLVISKDTFVQFSFDCSSANRPIELEGRLIALDDMSIHNGGGTHPYNEKRILALHRMPLYDDKIRAYLGNAAQGTNTRLYTTSIPAKQLDMISSDHVNIRLSIDGTEGNVSENLQKFLEGARLSYLHADGQRMTLDHIPVSKEASVSQTYAPDTFASLVLQRDDAGSNNAELKITWPQDVTLSQEDWEMLKHISFEVVEDMSKDYHNDLVESNIVAYHNFECTDENNSEIHPVYLKSRTMFWSPQNTIRGSHSLAVNDQVNQTYFPGEYIATETSVSCSYAYKHIRPFLKNPVVYYLVPKGVTPIQTTRRVFYGDAPATKLQTFDVIYDFDATHSLVIAQPSLAWDEATEKSPDDPWFYTQGTLYNRIWLDFVAGNDLSTDVDYEIQAFLAVDNNVFSLDERGETQGWNLRDTNAPINLSSLYAHGKSNPELPDSYVSLGSLSFRVKKNKELTSNISVKRPDNSMWYNAFYEAPVYTGDRLQYRFEITNNSTKDYDHLTILNVLPYKGDKHMVPNQDNMYLDRGSEFGVSLLKLQDHELFDFYYSEDAVAESIEQNDAAHFVTFDALSDPSRVTMIKAVLKPGKTIKSGERYEIVGDYQLKDTTGLSGGVKAYNTFAFSVDAVQNTYLETTKVPIMLTYPTKKVTLKKVDAQDHSKMLAGAKFEIYKFTQEHMDPQNDTLIAHVTTNDQGVADIELELNTPYYYVEKTAPVDYDAAGWTKFAIAEDTSELIVPNTYKYVDVPVSKIWAGKDTYDNLPDVTVHLKDPESGTIFDTLILNKANNYRGVFKKVYRANWERQWLKIEEEPIEGYTSLGIQLASGGYQLINVPSQSADLIRIPVTKTWDIRSPWTWKPSFVSVSLYDAHGNKISSITLRAENNYQGAFENIYKWDLLDPNKLAEYTVKEENIYGFVSDVKRLDDGGFAITNRDYTDIPVEKQWSNQKLDATLPEVTLDLLNYDGNVLSSVTLNYTNGYKGVFKDIFVTDRDSVRVVERPLEGYTSVVEGNPLDGFVVINTKEGDTPTDPTPDPPVEPTPNPPVTPTPNPEPAPETPDEAPEVPSEPQKPRVSERPRTHVLPKSGIDESLPWYSALGATLSLCGALISTRMRKSNH